MGTIQGTTLFTSSNVASKGTAAMSMKKIVVTGATGQQGRETVRALLQQKQWQVVAITRNPSSKGTHALEKMGAGADGLALTVPNRTRVGRVCTSRENALSRQDLSRSCS